MAPSVNMHGTPSDMSPRTYRLVALLLVVGIVGSLGLFLGARPARAAELPNPTASGARALCSLAANTYGPGAAMPNGGGTSDYGVSLTVSCNYTNTAGTQTASWGPPNGFQVYYYRIDPNYGSGEVGPFQANITWGTDGTCNTTTKQCQGHKEIPWASTVSFTRFDMSYAPSHNYLIWNGQCCVIGFDAYGGSVTARSGAYSAPTYPAFPPDWFADNPPVTTTTSTTVPPTTTTTVPPPPGNGGATAEGCDAGALGSIPLIGGLLDSASGMLCGMTNLALSLFVPSSASLDGLAHLWDAITTHAPFSVVHDVLAFLPTSIGAFTTGLAHDRYDAGNRRCPSITDLSHGNLPSNTSGVCVLPLDPDSDTGAQLALLRGILLFLFVGSTAIAVVKTTMRIANGGG